MLRRAVLAAAALAACGPATAAAYVEATPNLVVSPGAESPGALDGWTAPGWVQGTYHAWSAIGQARDPVFRSGGDAFFQPPGASVATQEVPVPAAVVAEVDAGTRPTHVSALVGGIGSAPDTATVRVTPLGADGAVLGPTLEAGALSAADRRDENGYRFCFAHGATPAGTRRLRVALEATGPFALVDEVSLRLGDVVYTAEGYVPQAKGCKGTFRAPPPPAPPTPAATDVALRRLDGRLRARFTLSAPASVKVVARRCTDRCRIARVVTHAGRAGPNGVDLARRARPGRYRVTVQPQGGALQAATLTVRRR